MKLLKYFPLVLPAVPVIALAQIREAAVSSDSVAYASVFAGDFSLLLSIVIGIIATFFVFRAAGKMGGGLFGSVLNYIGTGMVLVVVGTIATIIDTWFTALWYSVINTIFFALGYIFMVVGANKLLKGIMTN